MRDSTKPLEGKRLLLLGGSASMIGIVQKAQSLGCTVCVTDYYDVQRSPAKLIADAATDISVADADAVAAYIKDNKIDGVLTGFTDSYLMHYLRVCEKAGLPHCGSERAFGVATDKMLFKQACMESGVGVIPGTNAYDFKTVQAFAESNGYPLMLKPADNSGSRGVIKCETEDELPKCYEYALSYSASRNVMVERFMECDSIGIVYQLQGGEARLAAVCDREVYHARSGSAIVSGTRYPSRYLNRYIAEADEAMRKMLQKNGFRDGMVSPMAFVDDKGFYLCEMCYRPSGGQHYTLINDQNGVDGLALLIELAVTGKTESYQPEKENPHFHDCCGMIHILGVPEKKIALFSGLEEIKTISGVLAVSQELRVGQTIGRDGTTAQTLASVWLKAKSWTEYETLVRRIRSALRVCDENGESLMLT